MVENPMAHSLFNSLQSFKIKDDLTGHFYSLPELERQRVGRISKLPVSIRIVLESVLRNYDGKRITEDNVRRLANWEPNHLRTEEIPFVVARILLQDFTGVPLLVDLAAMRSAAARMSKSPQIIEPLVPAKRNGETPVRRKVHRADDPAAAAATRPALPELPAPDRLHRRRPPALPVSGLGDMGR